MGAVLIRSAFSANIKERRDCSTALFDDRGRMVAQAEHIPVHLGAMPDAVSAVMRLGLASGEVAFLNDPYTGGTHLPDVTLVSRTTLGYAVSRAHHADVGGIEELCERRGATEVVAAMDELYAYSERMVRAALARLPDGRGEAEDVVEAVEGDLPIRCAVELAGDAIRFDFAGTAPAYDGNLNCPLSVTKSACYFVVRCLTEPDLPASGGAFAPVAVAAPDGCLVNARAPHAVVAGNTETSSRIVDVAFAALGSFLHVPAQGQGTMNNVALGNESFTYYETIGGGQGACPDDDGPVGVHVVT